MIHDCVFFFGLFSVSSFIIFNLLNLFESFENSCRNKYFNLNERFQIFYCRHNICKNYIFCYILDLADYNL